MISAHTSAYNHNANKREIQLLHITQQDYLKDMNEVILMGDLNIHLESEENTIEKIQYVDLWKETHLEDSDPVFTFDSYLNTFIRCKYLGMEIRRMRLVRILIRKSPQRRVATQEKMQLSANTPLCEWTTRSTTERKKEEISQESSSPPSLLLTPLETPWWWKTFHYFKLAEQKDYLFCSDHFGLKMYVLKFESPQQMEQHMKEVVHHVKCDVQKEDEKEGRQLAAYTKALTGPFSNHRRVFFMTLLKLMMIVTCLLPINNCFRI